MELETGGFPQDGEGVGFAGERQTDGGDREVTLEGGAVERTHDEDVVGGDADEVVGRQEALGFDGFAGQLDGRFGRDAGREKAGESDGTADFGDLRKGGGR